MKHENNGACPMCLGIINRYPRFYVNMKSWFFTFQKQHPEMHTSGAGRGYFDQEAFFAKGASRAHYGQSSHNYNCALDIFVNQPPSKDIYPKEWFRTILYPNLPTWIEWYGAPNSLFFELPHIEVRGWRELVKSGMVELVEHIPIKLP